MFLVWSAVYSPAAVWWWACGGAERLYVYEGCLYGPWPCPSSLSLSNIKATVLILRFFHLLQESVTMFGWKSRIYPRYEYSLIYLMSSPRSTMTVSLLFGYASSCIPLAAIACRISRLVIVLPLV
jgi:hypothetical protein